MFFNKDKDNKKEEVTKDSYNNGFKFIFSYQEGNSLQKLLRREASDINKEKIDVADKIQECDIGTEAMGEAVAELTELRSKVVCIHEILNALNKWAMKNEDGALQFHMNIFTFRELCRIIHSIRAKEYKKIAQMPNDVVVQQALTAQLAEDLQRTAKDIKYLSDVEQLIERYKDKIYE